MTRILLTSFEPFGGHALNSSHEVGRLVAGNPPGGVDLEWLVLPVVAGVCVQQTWQRILERQPDFVVALGQAGGAKAVRLEEQGVNINDFSIPDNGGNAPRNELIEPLGPPAYPATLPLEEIALALREASIPVESSSSAGTYVCNHLLYGLLHRAEELKPGPRVGFIHLPLMSGQESQAEATPSLPLEVMTAAVRLALAVCASSATQEVVREVRDGSVLADGTDTGRPAGRAG